MRRFAVTAAVVATVLAGCGDDDNGSGDQSSVEASIRELTDASKNGDGAKICDQLFTKPLRDTIERSAGKPCKEEVTEKLFAQDARFDIGQVAISGSTATAKVTDQFKKVSLVSLVKQDGKWRIAGVTAAS